MVEMLFSGAIREFFSEFPLTYHNELTEGDSASASEGIALKVGIYEAQPYCIARPSQHDVIRPLSLRSCESFRTSMCPITLG
jgi:hypothetical protein